MDLGITGRRALVLGGMKGLGGAVAEALRAEGAEVIAASRGAEGPHRVDLADRASVDALADTLLADGGMDILVCNTGGPAPGAAASVASEEWSRAFEAMAASLFHLTSRLLPPMRERGWGRIVTIVSSGVEQPIPNLAVSNGVRAAVVGWSKTLASEVAADGVTVNCVLPGRIHTERVDQLDAAASKRTGKELEDVRAASRATIPAGRYGRPEEFAAVVAFLCSDPASYVTGSRVRCDGGMIRSI
ncbi:SDR family NAD(P)-dependent oxidoreductase [Paracoccus suum]|uniref:SDR family NAD(P)-dependent oxidoreductase n=1 Tax=Paracoccus suum TaxID=2259340 RepID=A0A344PLE4_9RHOB|nr:SDR family oxidoreductase [Paracoccus suum]AXC50199.1 SDR family NAD(P)-dependent oxidoreductase [Paracoccus suum]